MKIINDSFYEINMEKVLIEKRKLVKDVMQLTDVIKRIIYF